MKKIYSENLSDNEDTNKPGIKLNSMAHKPKQIVFDDNLAQNFSKKSE